MRKLPKNLPEWLTSRGWSLWYNRNYWVHPKTVADPSSQDYTNYRMRAEYAYAYEALGLEPFKSMGLPAFAMLEHANRNWQKIEDFLK